MKNWKLSALLNTPLRMSIMVGAIVLCAEYLFMILLREVLIPTLPLTVNAWDVIDAVILAAIVTPVLYFVFRKTQENEGRFRKINEASPSAIVIVNKQGLITDWNPAAQRIFQYSMEEAVGQQMHQLLAPPRYHDDAVRGFARFEETGDGPLIGKVSEISALRKDGSEFPIELSLASFKLKREWHAVGVIRDITERKQADITLQKSRDLLQSVVENVPARIFWKDSELRYLGCNSVFARDAGRASPDELTGRTDFDMGWKDQAELYRADDKAVMESGKPKLNFEEPQTTPDGSTIWLRTSKVPMRDDSNRVIGILGIYDDITARKAAEAALQESEQRFSTIFRASPIGISITRLADGTVIDANPAILHVLGYTREEAIGSTTLALPIWAHPEDRDRMLKLLREQGELRDFEAQFRTESGELGYFLVSAELIDLAGEQCLLALLHDITERKQAETQLTEQLEELRRWHVVTSGREGRVLGLKHEVNELLVQAGQPPRYPSAEQSNAE